MKKTYITPDVKSNRGALRCSILAGSDYAYGNIKGTFHQNDGKTTDNQLARQRTGSID